MEEKSVCSLTGIIDPRVEKAIELVQDDPRRSTADVAHSVGLSRSRLQHLIQTQTGATLRALRTAARITQAIRLLEDTTLSVKEIAVRLGYSQSSPFVRHFRRHIGKTPADWRKQQKMSINSTFGQRNAP
jgi:AraC-like DNA-binding protein